MQLDASVALLRARYEDFSESIGGVAVSRNGNVPTDVPERVANLWLRWTLRPDWTLSGGLRHVGRRYADNANTLQLPADTTAYYTTTQWFVGEGRRGELRWNHRF